MHNPVLLNEVLKYLNPQPNQNFVDATVGDGGQARAILENTAPNGKLIAIDRDVDSMVRAKSNLKEFENRVFFINDSFGNILKIVEESGFNRIEGILFDFGMSTSQLENSGRGFSFQKDEILDMRYDAKIPITAEDILNDYSEIELFEIFKKLGEEPKSKIIARALVNARKKKRIKTTKELVEVIEKVLRRHGKLHPATLIFQALRIEVNRELTEIEKVLIDIPNVLPSGGRAAFISFHSLEDRVVKNFYRNRENLGELKVITKKPKTSKENELTINPSARSAKLRIAEKL